MWQCLCRFGHLPGDMPIFGREVNVWVIGEETKSGRVLAGRVNISNPLEPLRHCRPSCATFFGGRGNGVYADQGFDAFAGRRAESHDSLRPSARGFENSLHINQVVKVEDRASAWVCKLVCLPRSFKSAVGVKAGMPDTFRARYAASSSLRRRACSVASRTPCVPVLIRRTMSRKVVGVPFGLFARG